MGGVMAYLDRGDTGRKDEAHVVGVNHHHDSNHTSSTPPTVLPWNLLLSLRVGIFEIWASGIMLEIPRAQITDKRLLRSCFQVFSWDVVLRGLWSGSTVRGTRKVQGHLLVLKRDVKHLAKVLPEVVRSRSLDPPRSPRNESFNLFTSRHAYCTGG